MTYRQAYDKIIDAYFKNQIDPLNPQFCFCGTLCDNSSSWFKMTRRFHKDFAGYTGQDFVNMESALLYPFALKNGISATDNTHERYEDLLFEGMAAALDVLKEIHISMGEEVNEAPLFTKRIPAIV